VDNETLAQERNFRLADGLHRLASQSNSFALLLRYQAQAERQYRRAIEEFERLKALREKLRNEANSAETETNETTYSPCETNPMPPGDPDPAPAPGPSGRRLVEPVQPAVQQYGSFTMGQPEKPGNVPSGTGFSYGS